MIHCLFLPFALVTCVQGCCFVCFECKAEEAAHEAADRLTGDALVAFNTAMDHLFDDQIDPMIDKVQAAVDASVKRVRRRAYMTALACSETCTWI